MTKGLQSAARTICTPLAYKSHTCSLSCIFCQVQEVNCPEGARETTLGCAPTENDQNPFAACGRQTLRGFFDTLSGTAKFAVPVPSRSFLPVLGHSHGSPRNAVGMTRLNGTAEHRSLPRNVPLPRFSFPFSFLAKLFPGIHIFFTVLPVYNCFPLLYNVKVRVYEDPVPD